MLLTADLLKNSVIVVSSTYLCVRQRGCSASIKMINVSGPRFDPCGMPADSCNQSDRTSPIFTQRGGHSSHNDVRQTQSNKLGDQHVVVNMVECFGEIDENRAHRLALVDVRS